MPTTIEIKTNVTQIARELNRTAAQVDDATEKGVHAVATVVGNAVDKEIGKIYRRAIPKRKIGKRRRANLKAQGVKSRKRSEPMWERTGELARGRTTFYPSPREAEIMVRGRAAKYTRRRHELGVSWTPKNPAGGVIRRNPFFADAVKKTAPQVVPVFEATFKNELGI